MPEAGQLADVQQHWSTERSEHPQIGTDGTERTGDEAVAGGKGEWAICGGEMCQLGSDGTRIDESRGDDGQAELDRACLAAELRLRHARIDWLASGQPAHDRG